MRGDPREWRFKKRGKKNEKEGCFDMGLTMICQPPAVLAPNPVQTLKFRAPIAALPG